jgi:hypothetical protein
MGQMLKLAGVVWAAVILFGFGSGLGTWLHRGSRLPGWFWLPLVSAAACLVSYLLFWVYFLSPEAGRIASWVSWGASVAAFVWLVRDADTRVLLRQRDAWLPGLLTALVMASYLASAFAVPIDINQRFRFPMPADNVLPRMFAERLYDGRYGLGVPPAPLDVDWRSSDRPPLQAAVIVAALPLRVGDLEYFFQFVETICQMGWVAALYALARTMGLTRRYVQFALLAAAGSPFFYFNSLYTWPKLLSTWLFLSGLAIVVFIVRNRDRVSTTVLPIAAGAITLGLLAHGGVAFSVLALPLLAAFWRPWRVMRLSGVAAAIAIALLLFAPWAAYQRAYDPPGNRLLKLHFGGAYLIDSRSTTQTIADTYRALTWRDYLSGRWANVQQQWFGVYPLPFVSVIDWMQWQQLMRHVPMLGFLGIGYVMLFGRFGTQAGEPFRLTRQLAWYALATMTIWIVVMILPSSTLIHQGSYVMTSLLVFCAAIFVAMFPPLVRGGLLSLHLLLFATCYFFSTRVSPGAPTFWRLRTFIEAALLFAAFVVSLRFLPADAARD